MAGTRRCDACAALRAGIHPKESWGWRDALTWEAQEEPPHPGAWQGSSSSSSVFRSSCWAEQGDFSTRSRSHGDAGPEGWFQAAPAHQGTAGMYLEFPSLSVLTKGPDIAANYLSLGDSIPAFSCMVSLVSFCCCFWDLNMQLIFLKDR